MASPLDGESRRSLILCRVPALYPFTAPVLSAAQLHPFYCRGNAGGGVTQILMPALAAGFEHGGCAMYTAWRWAFFIPGAIFLIMGALSFMFGQVRTSWGHCTVLYVRPGKDRGSSHITCAHVHVAGLL